jgi:hypothetical protein
MEVETWRPSTSMTRGVVHHSWGEGMDNAMTQNRKKKFNCLLHLVISTPISFASVLARVPWESHPDVWHSCTLKSKTDLAVSHKGAGGPILTESSGDSPCSESPGESPLPHTNEGPRARRLSCALCLNHSSRTCSSEASIYLCCKDSMKLTCDFWPLYRVSLVQTTVFGKAHLSTLGTICSQRPTFTLLAFWLLGFSQYNNYVIAIGM